MSLMLLLAASGPAHAFEHLGLMWSPEQMPITFYMTDYLEDSLPQTPNEETGRYYQEDVIIKGFCNWHWTEYCDENVPSDWERYEDAPCAEFDIEYGGVLPGNEGKSYDGITKVYFDDPQDELGTGINAVMQSNRGTVLVQERDGEYYYEVTDNDITFNNDIDWGTTQEIEAGCNGDVRSIESTGTHEIGHLLGMAHSCEQGDACLNDAFLTATMFWTGGSCDTSRNSPNSDDIDGITAIYGPFVSFDVVEGTERFGSAPLEICFELSVDEETLGQISEVNWRFGDGTTDTALEPCHTYEEQGQFTVTVDFIGEDDACGVWDYRASELAYVLVCDDPQPAFEVVPYDGLTYQVINNTVVDTYGCVDGIRYDVYAGSHPDGAVSGEPLQSIGAWSPLIQFAEEGTYTILLTAQGPAGTQATPLVVEVTEARSCSTGGGAGGMGAAGLLLALGALLRRRR
ncbi:MAG: matrixin family metalloprotease [Alphaproteobacteria bacterium]|nr:matrixin family metalloprotease [Alphaproteobacteria bacterium]